MSRRALFLIFVLACSVSAGKHDIYSGYSVHGVKLRDASDKDLFFRLQEQLNLDVWVDGFPGERDAVVMLPPQHRNTVLELLDKKDITHYLQIPDVAKNFEEHDEQMVRWKNEQRRTGRAAVYNDYPRYSEVDEYLERIAATYPNLVTLVNAGTSFEGKAIKYLKISTTNFEDTSKPIYYMDAMIHAREWVTTPVTLHAIHRLLEDRRAADQDLLEDIDWIILPIVNPDGYEYTHTDVRLWRRTRSVNPELDTDCVGVDANRNFDVEFGTLGISTNPCSDTYPGEAAFSEPETRIVRDILRGNVDRIQIYMNIHSHGNWILYGYGNRTLPENAVHLHFVGAAMGAVMDAVKLPQATFYRVGNSALILYPTSGSAQDYGQAVGVPFSYTLELPGYGYSFSVPPEFIDTINKETWLGIAESARLAKFYYQGRTRK